VNFALCRTVVTAPAGGDATSAAAAESLNLGQLSADTIVRTVDNFLRGTGEIGVLRQQVPA
jgi:hypothetical protein